VVAVVVVLVQWVVMVPVVVVVPVVLGRQIV